MTLLLKLGFSCVLVVGLTACGGRAAINIPAGASVGVGVGVAAAPPAYPVYAPPSSTVVTTTRRTYGGYYD